MDTYNISSSNLPNFDAAVNAIMEVRDGESPFDLSVSLKGVKVAGDVFHCHNQDFIMLESARRSLNDMLRIPMHMHEQLSVDVMDAVYNDLLQKRPNTSQITLRCVRDSENKTYVRVLAQSRHGIIDDAVLFRHISKKFPKSELINVRNAWVARTHSCIRVVFKDIIRATSDLVGAEARYGFDILNSEIIPNMTVLKGIIEFIDGDGVVSTFVVPKIFPAVNSSDKAEILEGIRRFFEYKIDGVDTLVRDSIDSGNMLDEVSRSKFIRGVYEQKIFTRRDVLELYQHIDGRVKLAQADDILRDDQTKTTPFALAFSVGTFAATMDSYLKRAQLEFVPNLWFGRPRK